ncbi:hypothetical protein [Gluconobacter frateurii]|uniref:hypothetical protein n=1 Tax=Gluconobacter frateurii TaxID=38308 RepID=UPI000C06E1F7|nr:hypothetical protein [Gluconobacter frateurii]
MLSPIQTGSVVWWRNGRYLVASVTDRSVAICPIEIDPCPRHRADVAPDWFEALNLRIDSGSVIRCVPFGVPVSSVVLAGGLAFNTLMARVQLGISKEVQARAFEDA